MWPTLSWPSGGRSEWNGWRGPISDDTLRSRSGERAERPRTRSRTPRTDAQPDHPADGGDVAHGMIRWLAQEGHRRSRVSGGSARAPAPLVLAPWRGEQVADVLKAVPGRPAASDDARLERDGHRAAALTPRPRSPRLRAADPPMRYGSRSATRVRPSGGGSRRAWPLPAREVPLDVHCGPFKVLQSSHRRVWPRRGAIAVPARLRTFRSLSGTGGLTSDGNRLRMRHTERAVIRGRHVSSSAHRHPRPRAAGSFLLHPPPIPTATTISG